MTTEAEARANIVQVDILLSDFTINVLSKCRHDGEQWLFDGQPMSIGMHKVIKRVLSKMESIADMGTAGMGLRE